MRPHLSLFWPAAGLLCLACSCAREPLISVRPLALELLHPGAPREEPVLLESLTFEEGAWRVASRFASLQPGAQDEAGSAVLALTRGSDAELRRQLELAPGSFNSLVLSCESAEYVSIRVDLFGRRKLLLSSQTKSLAPAGGLAALHFEMPGVSELKQPIDEIVLRLHGIGTAVRLARLDLVSQPMSSYLPDPRLGAELVAFGGESRRALGLTQDAPLRTRFEVPPRGRLFLSFGLPSHLNVEVRQARLAVRLREGERLVLERGFALRSSQKVDTWTEAVVDLGELEGRTLEASFELEVMRGQRVVCALGEPELEAGGRRRPSVLLITSDTHRGDHLGAAGEGVGVTTPVIDALAARGLLFEDCFTTINITNPSHIALMTGTHPRDHGILNNSTRLAKAAPTLAEAFEQAGYLCLAAVSSKHLGDPTSGLGQGFARMSIPSGKSTRDAPDTIAVVEDWLAELRGRPVFLWLHLFDAHAPYEPPLDFEQRYYPERARALDPALPEPEEEMLKALRRLKLVGVRDPELPRALYKAEISFLDQQLAQLLDDDRLRQGVIAFTADHGESMGEHGLLFTHGGLYRDILHVPLILSWPEAPAGTRVSASVSLLDLGRTLLDLGGARETPFPGRDLTELAQSAEPGSGPGSEPRFALHSMATIAAVNQDGWHLVLPRPTLPDGHAVELYYLPADPNCQTNLLESQFERARSLRALLLRWLEKRRELGWIGGTSDDTNLLNDLNALGYATAGGDESQVFLVGDGCDCADCRRFR